MNRVFIISLFLIFLVFILFFFLFLFWTGVLSIEAQQDDGTLADPVQTIVAWAPATRPMKFALDAATNVLFHGDRFLHGYVQQQFADYSGKWLLSFLNGRKEKRNENGGFLNDFCLLFSFSLVNQVHRFSCVHVLVNFRRSLFSLAQFCLLMHLIRNMASL